VKTGLIEKILKNNTYIVNSVSFSPDGLRLISVSGNGIKIWNLETGIVEKKYPDGE
jgi:WD40 repeat protein